jgi:hypothetical protein
LVVFGREWSLSSFQLKLRTHPQKANIGEQNSSTEVNLDDARNLSNGVHLAGMSTAKLSYVPVEFNSESGSSYFYN